MNDAAMMMTVETRDIVVDEVFPHAPDVVWKTLTTPELMGRWLMAPTGFEAREGTHFTFQTTDHAGGRMGRCHPLPGPRSHAERAARLLVEWRARG